METVFTWTPGRSNNPDHTEDDDIAESVLERRPPYLHPFRKLLKEALGLVFGAATSIFPDSGLMYFAAASDGGVVGPFADSEEWFAKWAPRRARLEALDSRTVVGDLPEREVSSRIERLLVGVGRPS